MDLLLFFDDGLSIDLVENIVRELVEPIPGFNLIEQNRENRNRNNDYYEITIPRYTDIEFKEHFRMSRGTFEELSTVIGNHMGDKSNLYASLNKTLLYSTWILSKPESFLSVSDRFDISPSSGHHIFKEVMQALTDLMPQYIQWPDDNKKQLSSYVFKQRSNGFPGVVGAIDGCHIPRKQPVNNAVDFYNRKGFHSIILQGVCDHRRKFIDVFIGMPGRMHDANVYRNSPLYQRLRDTQNPLLNPEEHLIGDSAYPLSTFLLTPFIDNGHLHETQRRYNIKLSTIRSIIERAFGLLKGKFRRLKYLDISDEQLGNNMIAAACVLHNFLIDHNDINELDEEDFVYDDHEEMDGIMQQNPDLHAAAQHKRNSISQML